MWRVRAIRVGARSVGISRLLAAGAVLWLALASGALAQTPRIDRADCRGWFRSHNDIVVAVTEQRGSVPQAAADALSRCVEDSYGLRAESDCDASWARFQEDARRDRELAASEVVLTRFRTLCPALQVPAASRDREQNQPQFPDYYARPYLGRVAAPRIVSAADRSFRTRIREAAARQRTNFAGDHVLFQFGCGSDCHEGGVINARTGAVVWLPFAIAGTAEVGAEDRIDYRLDSRILRLRGTGGPFGFFPPSSDFYFEFDGRGFTLLRIIPHRRPCACQGEAGRTD